ncbi:hypothetical protein VF14_04495 [Nostoc linckia z18]|jgi:hypothetical protein|uniref:Secreted protein n=2 Tax=Nostoc linckia TaxID=92942 RepID=A0A9Q6EK28_NOSLI|nr:hypothetical protein [Nostoc linckia]PHK40433.1 hypothetical protein VF12_10460 [Nostoc linckia z15]PHK47992.1 hypothetical protein VF13_02510 [Nostoc linckia z16]PHJ61092.1 hypothetical protein VF05_29220 [Nostoc linckia z3]PHJ64763.1 hypothetical protein VF02_12145 [Nostoc linckia z1]PHJ70997.1 hypothetical protein VF03_21060 [Nostoc linckia z2]
MNRVTLLLTSVAIGLPLFTTSALADSKDVTLKISTIPECKITKLWPADGYNYGITGSRGTCGPVSSATWQSGVYPKLRNLCQTNDFVLKTGNKQVQTNPEFTTTIEWLCVNSGVSAQKLVSYFDWKY